MDERDHDRHYNPYCSECGGYMNMTWTTHDTEGLLTIWKCRRFGTEHGLVYVREWPDLREAGQEATDGGS